MCLTAIINYFMNMKEKKAKKGRKKWQAAMRKIRTEKQHSLL